MQDITKERIFKKGELVMKGHVIAKVLIYEPHNKKYLIEAVKPRFAWRAMWIQGHRLKPIN